MDISLQPINLKERTIIFSNPVDEANIIKAIEIINNINIADDDYEETMKAMLPMVKMSRKDFPPIKIIMSTYGGSVYDGFALYDVIKQSKTPVVVECAGKIMSMGIIIMLAATKRISHKHTTFMVHSVSSCTLGQVKDMEDDVEEAKRLNTMLFDIIENHSRIKRSKLEDLYEYKKNWFMSANEAKDYGLVDEVID